MKNEEWITLIKRVPPELQGAVILTLNSRAEVCVESILRYETTHLVIRGRVAGTTDEGRLFFVPYAEISMSRVERILKVSEVFAMYGEEIADEEDRLLQSESTVAEPLPNAEPAPMTPTAAPVPTAADAAATAKNILLERIRATKAAAAAGATRNPNK